MKKITLLILMLFLSFAGFSQVLNEGFEGATFPPTTPGNWAVFQNGFGSNAWTINTTLPHTGTKAAQINSRQFIGQGVTSKDFLATPLVTIPNNGQLRFWSRTAVNGNQGTKFQIRVASGALPANQTDEAAYTNLVQEYAEGELSTTYNIYEEKIVNFPPALWNTQVYIAFVDEYTQTGTTLSGDSWLLDDIMLVERCLDPTNLTANAITTNSANLTWLNPSGATSWEIEVLPGAPTNLPTGSGLVVNSNPYTATALTGTPFTPLQPGTQYKFYVRALCTLVPSQWVGPYTFTTNPLGYNCSAPIVIPTLPYLTSSDTALYGNNIPGPQGAGCAGGAVNYMSGNDVVYTFTAATTNPITITMTGAAYSSIFLYSSCANIGVSCLAGVANSTTGPRIISNFPVVAGQTYYIVISTRTAPVSTAYTLDIRANTCTNLAATFSVVNDCANAPQFFVRANVTNMGSATSVVATDNQASPAQTITAPGQVQFGPFPNGTNVTIHLENGSDPNCFINSTNQTQLFCPATNDLCANAIPIACGGTATQTTVGATATGAPGTCGTTGGAGGLWYSFVGTGDIVTFSLCGSAYNTKIQVVTGVCGTFTCVGGNDDFTGCGTQSQVLINSVLGTNYYVYVYGNGAAQGVFTLNVTCVAPPPPPANDNCDAATVVAINTTQVCTVSTPGTTAGASPSTPAGIAPCVGTADDDVWFEFVATNTVHIITLTGTTVDINHILYSNACGTLTQMYCSNPNGSLATGLTVGATYKIRVYTNGSVVNQVANFNVCITVPPANDVCSNAVFVPVNSNSTCVQNVQGTVSGATASLPAIAAPCLGTADDDVWFQFIASNSYLNIALSNLAGGTNLNHAVYSGSCTGLTQLQCSTANNLISVANNLIVGQIYYIRVWSNASTPQTTTFDLCITTPSTCSNSSSMCGAVDYTNTTGVTTLGPIGCLALSPNPKFFVIQVQTTGPLNYQLTQSDNGVTPNLDVDYAAWGPFTSQSNACSAISGGQAPGIGVPVTQTTGCSFSAASTEYLNIANAVAGQFYIVLITNYSGDPGEISFTQTNVTAPGAGTSVCCPEANFSYLPSFYCKNGGANPVATINPNSEAGVFSNNTGVVFVNNLTGEINLAASAPGNHVITNTIAPTATCSTGKMQTFTITIAELGSGTISYTAGSYCKTDTTPVTVTPVLLTPGGTYSSFPLGGLSINSATGTFTPSTSTAGNHVVRYTVPANAGCPAYFTETPVVITPLPIATFNYNPVTFCQNGADPSPVFTAGGTAGTFSSDPGLSINAVTGEIDLSASTPGTYIVKNEFAAAGGCGLVSEPFTITITAPATAGFSYQESPVCKAPGNANPVADMFFGATGQNFSSTDPGLVFVNTTTGEIDLANSTPGTYTVTNVVAAANGCTAVTESNTITITALPTVSLNYNAPDMYCNSGATPQTATLNGTGAYTGGTYSVVPSGLIIDSVLGTITPNGSTPGTYDVTYTTTASGGCGTVSSAPVTITITAPPIANFSYPGTPYCQAVGNANPTVQLVTGATAQSFASSAGLVFADPATGEINLAASTPGTYMVTNTVTGTGGCASVTSLPATITITAAPTASFSYNAASFCDNTGDETVTTFSGTTGGTFTAAPTGLIINSADGTITPTGSTAGTYVVSYTVVASGGCLAFVATTPITIKPEVEVVVTEDCVGNDFTLTVSPFEASFDPADATYSWTAPDGIVSGPSASPELIITETGTYISSVTYNGCTTNTPHVVVNTECIIQKGISPNGDEFNQSFKLSDAKKLEIFNRYGTEVYSYTNYTNQWHGQSNNGNELPDGTYFYVIERNSGEKKTGWIYINR